MRSHLSLFTPAFGARAALTVRVAPRADHSSTSAPGTAPAALEERCYTKEANV